MRALTRTRLSKVGTIGSFSVYDLFYYSNAGEASPYLRSILVGKSVSALHEIHTRENQFDGTLFATVIIRAGSDWLIKAKFDDGGKYHGGQEDYLILTDGGVVRLDFQPLFEAAKNILPPGWRTWPPASTYNFDKSIYRVGARTGSPGCCNGWVDVPFRIEQGTVVAGSATFIPD